MPIENTMSRMEHAAFGALTPADLTPEAQTNDMLDLLADMMKHWERHRARGYTPGPLRRGILVQLQEIAAISSSGEPS